jgi:hypothetical protein
MQNATVISTGGDRQPETCSGFDDEIYDRPDENAARPEGCQGRRF